MDSTLNAGQKAAAEGIFKFLMGEEKELNISGPGGVGKTHLMGYVIDEVMPMYHKTCSLMGLPPKYNAVEMTATTNKATDVLGKSTGRPTNTIYSVMNLKVQDDFRTGKSTVTKTKSWTVHRNKIIFVDEASMIDTPLRNYILEGTHDCKIIYVGDHCQLAPIMEHLSPVYRENLPFFELTEQMRTNDPHLQALNLQLRTTVESGEFFPIQAVPGVIDWITDEAQLQDEIDAHFIQQGASARVLAYTNDRVGDYNSYIRALRQLPSTPVEGDVLINNQAVQLSPQALPTETEVRIETIHARTKETISEGVELELIVADVATQYGYYNGMAIPADRDHFVALMKWYAQNKNWERYFYLKNSFPEMRPRDASTTHKAQGSTFDTVFIDMGDLSTCRNPDQAARLLYVAASRARKRVVMYGNLAAKFGGIIR